MRITVAIVALYATCMSACASQSGDRSPRAAGGATNAYFACMDHCVKKSAGGNACLDFDGSTPLACEIFQADNVRSADQDYIVEQYPACMDTCKKPSRDGLFCREFNDDSTEVCRAFYQL